MPEKKDKPKSELEPVIARPAGPESGTRIIEKKEGTNKPAGPEDGTKKIIKMVIKPKKGEE